MTASGAEAGAGGVLVVSRAAGLDAATRQVTRALLDFWNGPLTGLFVSDQRLLDAARLPFTREVGRLSGLARDFEHQDMKRLLEQRVRRFESELAAIAADLQRPWHCEQCGGDPVTCAADAVAVPGAVVLAPPGGAPGVLGGASDLAVEVILREDEFEGVILSAAQGLGRLLGRPARVQRVLSSPDVAHALDPGAARRASRAVTLGGGARLQAHAGIVLISARALPDDSAARSAWLQGFRGLVVLMGGSASPRRRD